MRKEDKLSMRKLVSGLVIAIACTSTIAFADGDTASGVFTGTGIGHNGEVQVDVAFDAEGRIESVSIAKEEETPHIAKYALETVPEQIVAYNSVNVDMVSGATMSSRAVISAVKDAISQAGFDEAEYQAEVPKEGEEITLEKDVVIVGAGGAGLSAAIEAAGQGADVLLVETNAYAGGASLYALGMVLYAADEAEAQEHAALTAEQLCQGIKEHGSEYFNDEIAMDYLNHSKENAQWLIGLLPEESYVVKYMPGNFELNGVDPSEFTYATINPGEEYPTYYIEYLCQKAVDNGAEILLNTTADALLADENQVINGIHAVGQNGNDYTIHAKKVILASGGYGGDFAKIVETSDMDRPFYLGPTSNKGFGITAAEEFGAKTEYTHMPDLEGYNQQVYSTYGGLVVNDKAQVLNTDDEAIANLYAAGELTCVQIIDPDHFAGGENLSWNIYSGRIAGLEAASTME